MVSGTETMFQLSATVYWAVPETAAEARGESVRVRARRRSVLPQRLGAESADLAGVVLGLERVRRDADGTRVGRDDAAPAPLIAGLPALLGAAEDLSL